MSDNLIDRPVIPLPDGFTWGFVTARSIHAMADTMQDWDRYPEARGSNGRAIFTPMVRFNKHTEDPTAFVQYEVARARIREGTLIDAEGLEGIWLISGDYEVSFQIDGGSIPGFPITVTEEHTQSNPLDLVTYSPLEVPPGYVEIVRIVDRERAEDAAEAAEGYAEDARQFSQTETFEGYIASAESARDLANQYQLNASESATSATQSANQAEEARDATADLVSDLPDSFDGIATIDYVDSEVSNLQDSVIVVGPNLSAGYDLDDFLGNHMSYVSSANSASIVNRPPDSPSLGATVIVYSGGAGTQNQEWIINTGTISRGHKWVRSRTGSTSGWGSWHKLVFEEDLDGLATEDYVDNAVETYAPPGSIHNPISLGTTHLDDVRDPGYYYQSLIGNITSENGYPINSSFHASMEVRISSGGHQRQQFLTFNNAEQDIFYRVYHNYEWRPWRRMTSEEYT